MHTSLRSLALMLLLAACGDDDGSEANPVDGSTPSSPDAGSNLDATLPAIQDAAPSTDAALAEPDATRPLDFDAGEVDAYVPPQPTADQLLGAAAEAKTRNECGVFTAGKLPADFFAVRDAYERCVANCVVNAPCAALKGTFCRANQTPTSVDTCISACPFPPEDGFACGDGNVVTYAMVCDLEAQCPNGADQANCTDLFSCSNGKKIPARLVCDGLDGCGDRSDESQGCAVCAP